MTDIISTNITSPLGLTTAENYTAVKRGDTSLKIKDGCLGVPGKFCVGICTPQQKEALKISGFSWFESIVLRSVREALSHVSIDIASPRVIFILATSTAGIEELGEVPEKDGEYLAPGVAAKKIARSLGLVNDPLLVSNACISGATAQMMADRLISAGLYDYAIVCGADVVSAFVLAGFSSFKALSPTYCRPFDIERLGLNIGECAATIILKKSDNDTLGSTWRIIDGCLDNDAYHVSAPLPSGEGVSRAIARILTPEVKAAIACVTAHGTATMFNDQMESEAIESAGLGSIPATAYKAHFGHTFGASGIVEAIITMRALDEDIILPALGFEEIGVSGKINISNQPRKAAGKTFVKTQSGFGGCNGAMIYSKDIVAAKKNPGHAQYCQAGEVIITPDKLVFNRNVVRAETPGYPFITEIFKKYMADDSRYFKMDQFSRLAYVGAGLVAGDELKDISPEDTAVFIFTKTGSVLADRKHLSTFSDKEEFYPSPAVFINTLPNIVLGEIAIKNNVKGETTLVMLPEEDEAVIDRVIRATLDATRPKAMIYGWVDCADDTTFKADLKLLKQVSQ